MNITTPKLLEYTAKAVMLASTHAGCRWDEKNTYMRFSGCKKLTFVIPCGYCVCTTCSVQIGAFEKYKDFIDRVLARIEKCTGKKYTINDLNIY